MNKYITYLQNVRGGVVSLSRKENLPIWRVLIDYFYCLLRYGTYIHQYTVGNFWRYSGFQRKKCITYPRMVRMYKLNNSRYVRFLNNKVDFNNYFADLINRDWIYIKDVTKDSFVSFLKLHGRVIIKPVSDSQGGSGIRILDYNKDIINDQLFTELKKEDIIVEEVISQHPGMVFNNASVNTIRVMTIVDSDGKAHIVKAILRAGVGNAVVDNFHAGGSMYEIDLETGVVCSSGMSISGSTHIKHPGTDIIMLGYQIPNWNKVLEASVIAAEKLPQIRIIGWDLAITETGVELIEGNHNPNFEVCEFLGSIGYYDVFKNIIKLGTGKN